MKCKDIQQLIIDSSEGELSRDKLALIEKHLERCSDCAAFRDDIENIRWSIKNLPVFKPSPDFLKQTQSRCQTEIAKAHIIDQKASSRTTSSSTVPSYIWAALAVLISITGLFVLLQIINIKISQPLSFQNILVLSLIIQNTVMLFFTPILIKKYRVKNHDFKQI